MYELIDKLKNDLSEDRFKHSVGVAECAKELALRFDCDPHKAYVAGLLHDCATKLTSEQMLDLALDVGLRRSNEISNNPVADYHSKLGSFVARNDYGIDDTEILQAISSHQSGAVGMTKLDMIISLADAIEPSRVGDRIDSIRVIAKTDLLQAYIEKCALYMSNILKSNKPLSKERVEVYNYILSLK